MAGRDRTDQLIREFFKHLPDYELCRALAENIQEGVTTHADALRHLHLKAQSAAENRSQIEDKLNQRKVVWEGRPFPIRKLTIQQILRQDDANFAEIIRFYFKHPYAHRRTFKTRLLPRWIRTFFLRVLFGHAQARKLDLDYRSYHEILTLL